MCLNSLCYVVKKVFFLKDGSTVFGIDEAVATNGTVSVLPTTFKKFNSELVSLLIQYVQKVVTHFI